jgi:hypothetical protein
MMLVGAGTTWVALGILMFARGNQEAATIVAIGAVFIATGIMAQRVARKAHALATLTGVASRVAPPPP